jgi:hypothetical protein
MVGLGAILSKHIIQSHVHWPTIGSSRRKRVVEGKGVREVFVLGLTDITQTMLDIKATTTAWTSKQWPLRTLLLGS